MSGPAADALELPRQMLRVEGMENARESAGGGPEPRPDGVDDSSNDNDDGPDTHSTQTRRRARRRARGGEASGGGISSGPGPGDRRYPRKRALRACRLCRVRKMKCDNMQPACGSCVAIGTSCDYGDSQADHSSFDPASLEILRKLGDIISVQRDLVQVLRNNSGSAGNRLDTSSNNVARSSPGSHINGLHSQDRHAHSPADPGPTTADHAAAWSTPVTSYHAVPPTAHQPPGAAAQMTTPLGDTLLHRTGGFSLNTSGHSADADAMSMLFAGSAAGAVHGGDDAGASLLSGEAATARWVELLADDAALDEQMMAMYDAEGDVLDSGLLLVDRNGGNSNGDANESGHAEDLATPGTANGMTPLQQATKMADDWQDAADAGVSQTLDSGPAAGSQQPRQAEEQLWHTEEEIQLLPQERFYFENFLDRLSKWIDLFDRMERFSSLVPHLAVRAPSLLSCFRCLTYELRNAGLLNAIFALSCRHLSLNPGIYPNTAPTDRNVALQYYYQTLHYVQKAMRFRSYQTSLELLATTLIVSTYEMIDGCRKAWERHLEGACWILRSQITEVETTDFKSAVWWAWLRQDVWAAFSEKRKVFTDWIPVKPYAALTPYELASRTVWIMAQVVNFCALPDDDAAALNTAGDPVLSASAPSALTAASITLFRRRLQRARELQDMLREWRAHMTAEFAPLPISEGRWDSLGGQANGATHAGGPRPGDAVFQPMSVRPACLGVGLQVHYASQVLLCANTPSTGSLATFLQRQATIQECIKTICGIAMTLTDDASSLMSSQCLFIAGMFVQDQEQSKAILDLLAACEARTGWAPRFHGEELAQIMAAQKCQPAVCVSG